MLHGKNVQKMCDVAASGTGIQAAVSFQLGSDVLASGAMEVIGGAASVQLEGRISPDSPWMTLATGPGTLVAQGLFTITRALPEMRVNITTNPGTIRVWVMA